MYTYAPQGLTAKSHKIRPFHTKMRILQHNMIHLNYIDVKTFCGKFSFHNISVRVKNEALWQAVLLHPVRLPITAQATRNK